MKGLFIFRRDFRLTDNTALLKASKSVIRFIQFSYLHRNK